MDTSEPDSIPLILRPSVVNPIHWFPDRPPKTEWNKIRKVILERDNFTCAGCGHRATKYMNIHHTGGGTDNHINHLVTLCVACHAILHIGRNLDLKILEIWKSELTQRDIVIRTRAFIKAGYGLEEVKKMLPIKRGRYTPKSMRYATDLVNSIGTANRAYLEEPLCAIFVNLSRWQLE
jgi:hypothetical protein